MDAFTPPGKRSVSPYSGLEREEPLFEGYSEVNGHVTQVLQPFSAHEFGMRWNKVRAEMRAQSLGALVLSAVILAGLERFAVPFVRSLPPSFNSRTDWSTLLHAPLRANSRSPSTTSPITRRPATR